MFRTVPFRLNNVLSEGIELAFHAGAMLLQDFRKLPECGVVGSGDVRSRPTHQAGKFATGTAKRHSRAAPLILVAQFYGLQQLGSALTVAALAFSPGDLRRALHATLARPNQLLKTQIA